MAGVLIVSAIPFFATQALAESDVGKRLQERLEENKAGYQQKEAERQVEAQRVRAESQWYGPSRPKWLGPLAVSYPAHLSGLAPGDYGFDPASLAVEEASFDRYFELELLHARWAMLGLVGAIIPEVLQYSGLTTFAEPRWWAVGAAKLGGEDLNYLGVAGLRIAGGQGILIIAICQVLLMFGPEYARSCGIEALEPLGLYLPGDKNYPGSFLFDPLGFSEDVEMFEIMKVREIKNGRLAMVAWAAFFVQGAVTKEGPIQNLLTFVEDPKHNVFSYLE